MAQNSELFAKQYSPFAKFVRQKNFSLDPCAQKKLVKSTPTL